MFNVKDNLTLFATGSHCVFTQDTGDVKDSEAEFLCSLENVILTIKNF